MNELDDQLRSAAEEVRNTFDGIAVPELPTSRFSAAQRMPLAIAAVLILVAGTFVVASRVSEPVNTVAATENGVDDSPMPNPRIGQLTNADPGVYLTLSPNVGAWNADETRLVVYRTGAADAGHVVIDTATGEVVVDVDLAPPDIEQLYWHPLDPTRLVAFESAERPGDPGQLWAFDIDDGERHLLAEFDDCPTVNPGYPSPPAETGELVALCGEAPGAELVVYSLQSATVTRSPIPSGVESVRVTPTGEYFILSLANGTVQAMNSQQELFPPIDTGGDNFALVSTEDGDAIAAVRYSGDDIGSLVEFAPDKGEASVIIGPDTGYEYPPAGTNLSGGNGRVVFSTRGPVAGLLGGRVALVELQPDGEHVLATIEHGSLGTHGYWSEVFVSLSPSGRFVAYSSDTGGDTVDIQVAEFPL